MTTEIYGINSHEVLQSKTTSLHMHVIYPTPYNENKKVILIQKTARETERTQETI